eukprot:TRINITY_DN14747_c0_g1_i3.p1 TRINITY_DN14747_c0_g1~~TRINITY_DN14747_c0_g1_i3.p1  ORF type:complete len:221 (+),score=27.10 TRINITY_DN14747_c0_g1_i3:458-1120(+)
MNLFLQIDENLDGRISFNEFQKASAKLSRAPSAQPPRYEPAPNQVLELVRDKIYQKWRSLRDAFRAVDTDHNQCISVSEFKELLLARFHSDLTQQQLQTLLILFDRNSDGVISYLEFVNVVEGRVPPPEKNSSGSRSRVDSNAVLNQLRAGVYQSFDNLRTAFLAADRDGSGAIEANELAAVLRAVGIQLQPGEVEELVSRFDLNSDRKIQYNEFVQALQ